MGNDSSDWAIVQTMKRLGGAFANALAVAYEKADSENAKRIREAFPDLWSRYGELAALELELDTKRRDLLKQEKGKK